MIARTARRSLQRAAFTLMEMLVVVAIIVVLAGVGGYYYMRSLDDAKRDAAKVQVHILTQACQAYELRNNSRPPSLAALLERDPEGGKPFLDDPNALKTPWGSQYQYEPSGTRNGGMKPDIWADSPVGQIGNWPAQR